MEIISQELFDYAVATRRYLHQYPETAFDLDNTVAFVRGELEKMGIAATDRYGRCSLVAEIGPAGKPVLGLRADMDALPVQEKVDLPFKSKIDGKMHACGHDTHTAILLSVARKLKEIEDTLPCRVRFLFQPAEEHAVSGAKMMVDNGAMDGVDAVICTHCENMLDSGNLGLCAGDYMAACAPIQIIFHGKTSHATLPEGGVDAIAMAHEAYGELKNMVREEAGNRRYIWSVGVFQGGQVHNVIADRCDMHISFRFYDSAFAQTVERRTREICDAIAARYGGRVEVLWTVSCGAVHNDETMVTWARELWESLGYSVRPVEQRMSSEDFGWMQGKAPGMLFRYGTRNEALGCTGSAHNNNFCVDEAGMKYAIAAFLSAVTHADQYFERKMEA